MKRRRRLVGGWIASRRNILLRGMKMVDNIRKPIEQEFIKKNLGTSPIMYLVENKWC